MWMMQLWGVLNFAISELNLTNIYLKILDYNLPSQRLAERCGFPKEGILRSRILKNGKRHDLFSYSLLKEEFNEGYRIYKENIKMTNLEKYNQVLMDTFNLSAEEIRKDLNASDVELWDSMGQMRLASALEEVFEIFLDPEDMIQLISYQNGVAVLRKYGIDC